MTTAVPKAEPHFPEWRVDLILEMQKHGDAETGRFPDGTAEGYFKRIGEQYETNWITVRNAYYAIMSKGMSEYIKKATPEQQERIKKGFGSSSIKDAAQEKLEALKKQLEEGYQEQGKAATAPPVEEPSQEAPEIPAGEKVVDPRDIEYTPGTIVKVKVTSVERVGVKVETVDGNRMDGWIYIGNIINGYVSDTNKYFRFGDIVNARILKYDENRPQLDLSTKGIPLKPQGTQYLGVPREGTLQAELSTDPEKVVAAPATVEELNRKIREAEERAAKAEAEAKTAREAQSAADRARAEALREKEEADRRAAEAASLALVPAAGQESTALAAVKRSELDQLKLFLAPIVGPLSPEAEQLFVELITQHTLFTTTLAVAEGARTFKPDLGVLFAREIGARVSERP